MGLMWNLLVFAPLCLMPDFTAGEDVSTLHRGGLSVKSRVSIPGLVIIWAGVEG